MMDAYIGAETGVVKGLDFTKNSFQNLNPIAGLDRSQQITRMCRFSTRNLDRSNGIVDDDDEKIGGDDESILCALVNRQMKLFDPTTNSYTNLFECDGGVGPIKGLEALQNGKLATGVESGEVNVWNLDGFKKEVTINAGENLCRMRANPIKSNVLATGGKENPLKLWDLENPTKPSFMVKNVKNDYLDLRIPIWETDFRFAWNNECIVTCTGHHHIRLYDPRGPQRRPVVQAEWGECPFTSISLTPRENQLVAGNSQGNMGLFDLRGKGTSKLVHCFRGFAGSISSIECHPSEPYVASCGIDRFARLHHIFKKEQLNKIYCKARLNCLLLSDDLSISKRRRQGDKEDDERVGTEDGESYQSDDEDEEADVADEDDAVWKEMKRVNDVKKRRRAQNSTSSVEEVESDSSSIDLPEISEEKQQRKPKKKAKGQGAPVEEEPRKRQSSSPPSQQSLKKRPRKASKAATTVPKDEDGGKSTSKKRKCTIVVGGERRADEKSESPVIARRKMKHGQNAG